VQGAALDFVQKGGMEGNACELYICCILLSRGYAFCFVATVQFIKLGSNTDQRTELFVTTTTTTTTTTTNNNNNNNNMDNNTALDKIIVYTVKIRSPNQNIQHLTLGQLVKLTSQQQLWRFLIF